MIRKLVVVAAAIAMPVTAATAISAGVSPGVAGAKTPNPTPITCDTTGSVTFTTPGLSEDGQVSATAKTGTTVAKFQSVGDTACNGGNVVTVDLTGKNNKCNVALESIDLPVFGETAPQWTEPPGCTGHAKDYYYDLAWGFAGGDKGGGASSIVSELKKGIAFKDTGVSYTLIPTSATAIDPGGTCGASAVGFQINGTVKKTAGTFSDLVCLTTDTGTGTTDVFGTDLTDLVLATANKIDSGSDSTVISSAGVGSPSALTISD
jgi:hypothetical protein